MHIVNHCVLPLECHEGCQTRWVAGPALGHDRLRVRLVVLEAGASTEARVFAGEGLLLVQAGSGKRRLDGEPQCFQAPCSLHVPARVAHEVVNSGAVPLQLVEIEWLSPAEG